MPEPLEHPHLGREPPEGVPVVDEVWTNDLRDDEPQQAVVPGEEALVPLAAAEEADRVAAGRDLVALLELPRLAGPAWG
jgi:hypothetical protein